MGGALRRELAEELGLERYVVHGMRWFTSAEIAEGIVTFSPRDLTDQLARVRVEGVPTLPREIPATD